MKRMQEVTEEDKKTKFRKYKKIIYLVAVVVISVIAAAFGFSDELPVFFSEIFPVYEQTDSAFEVHYIDVGQGDSSLIICDGQSMLIDAGENGHEIDVLNYLRTHGIEKLDYIIASHQHSDHIGGLSEVLDEIGTDNIIMPRLTKEQTPTNSTYTAFLKSVQNSGAKVIASKVGATYTLGSASFEILGPVTDDAEDINNMSVVVKMTYGENIFLFTGDAEKEEEREIIATGADLDCDVLKVGHHGSGTSSGVDFLDAVSPEICVIQVGADNDYGHPHENIVERLESYADEIYRTDLCGDIVITCDGNDLNVSYENQ
ncbi:MAG: MBL fold metallo-hydrolase [Clostridia bacterium]|nr:MBL fold metallo-hydrolase [Clostridia bacterium]